MTYILLLLHSCADITTSRITYDRTPVHRHSGAHHHYYYYYNYYNYYYYHYEDIQKRRTCNVVVSEFIRAAIILAHIICYYYHDTHLPSFSPHIYTGPKLFNGLFSSAFPSLIPPSSSSPPFRSTATHTHAYYIIITSVCVRVFSFCVRTRRFHQ